ncbi:MAG: hypothetical protein Q7S37_00220 [bacterium]|nr:hypothetical protein [bacterium]
MKRFLIFFFSGIVLIGIVFYIAQLSNMRSDNLITSPYQTPQGKVLGVTTKSSQPKQIITPINIIITKDPIFLYWPQKVTIETLPNIEVRMKTTYFNGNINNNGTKSGTSDRNGKFVVSWTVNGKKDILGLATVDVSVGSLETYNQSNAYFQIVTYQK